MKMNTTMHAARVPMIAKVQDLTDRRGHGRRRTDHAALTRRAASETRAAPMARAVHVRRSSGGAFDGAASLQGQANVNKSDVINAVADRLYESKARVSETVDAVFDVMSGALASGDDVRLPNFGVFDVKHMGERTARNPRTREEVKIPAGKKARFKPGKALKEALDGAPAPSR
jgi:DNA-binding protein HU-beta